MADIQYFQLWSGGKDSTASIVLENIHRKELNIPPSLIVMVEVMFDNAEKISGEYPEHNEWVYTKATCNPFTMYRKCYITICQQRARAEHKDIEKPCHFSWRYS
jgi:hypothetical protein